jgi:hypothetical protein
VKADATPPRLDAEPLPRSATAFADRLLAATPLFGIYVVLCGVYVVEVWRRVTPWLFTDELELTQLSRSIASTGRAARRGAAHSPDSLYTYATAPLWLLSNVATSYAAVKYVDVFVMASAVFPTYLLARMLVRRPAALFAAAAAGAIPALAYSSYIVEEPFAYPYAALCFLLMAKALVTFRRRTRRAYGWSAAAVLASLAAWAIKGELLVTAAMLVLAVFFAGWSSEWARRRRASWSLGDWIGIVTLVFGVVFVVSGAGSRYSQEWFAVTTYYKHRIIVMGDWAAGSLAIGVGIIPFVAGLAALFRAPGETSSRELRMFRCVALAGFLSFGLYTGMKAAYLSTVFETRVEERNLIYIAPLLFIGTALVLERRSVNRRALFAAGAYVLYLVGYAAYHSTQSPYEMGVRLYSDALGFAIAQQANLVLYLTPRDVRLLLILVLAVGLFVLLAPRLFAGRNRLVAALTLALGIAIVAWNLTGEISAAASTNYIGRQFGASLGRPFSWVDDVAHGRPTLYFDQGVSDQTAEWMLEFWNKSIVSATSLDGTIHGPGPAGAPNVTTDGKLYWSVDPADLGRQFDYVVEAAPCIDFSGARVGTHTYVAGAHTRVWSLVRLTHPNRLRTECTGISPDGWTGPLDSNYYRFSGGAGGWLRIDISRKDWSGPTPPSPVHVVIGTLGTKYRQPALAHVVRQIDLSIASGQTLAPVWLRAPGPRFAVRVVVDDKFVPCQVEPTVSGDCRRLGAEVSYHFVRSRPSAKPRTGP